MDNESASKLENARSKINEIDSKMAELFQERMEAASIIADYKKVNGLPILDETREKELIRKNAMLIDSKELREYYVEFFKNTIDVSKQYQRRCVSGARIAYCGNEGAFGQMAADALFPDGEHVAFKSFAEAYEAVENGDCDVAVLPIENSYAGEVGTVMDIMFQGKLYINDLYTLQVEQCLLGTKDAHIEDIKRIVSHPQALAQCEDYINELGAKTEEAGNTVFAVRKVAEEGDKTVAAIGSRKAAEIYGLKILDSSVSANSDNSTRFAVFARSKDKYKGGAKSNHIVMMFTVKDEAGALAKAVNVLGAYGYNMSVVRSRPRKSLAWAYYFYVEADGDGNVENEERMIKALGATCDKLRIIGDMEGRAR